MHPRCVRRLRRPAGRRPASRRRSQHQLPNETTRAAFTGNSSVRPTTVRSLPMAFSAGGVAKRTPRGSPPRARRRPRPRTERGGEHRAAWNSIGGRRVIAVGHRIPSGVGSRRTLVAGKADGVALLLDAGAEAGRVRAAGDAADAVAGRAHADRVGLVARHARQEVATRGAGVSVGRGRVEPRRVRGARADAAADATHGDARRRTPPRGSGCRWRC